MSEFNQFMKLDKLSCIICADIEALIRRIDGCANNPENSSTTKIGEHIPGRYLMSTTSQHLITQKTNIRYATENIA